MLQQIICKLINYSRNFFQNYTQFSLCRVPSNITVTSEPVAPLKTPVKPEHDPQVQHQEQPHFTPSSDRRLRSHHEPEVESSANKQETLSSMASTSSECSTPHTCSMSSTMDIFRSALPMNIGVTKQAKAILDETFAWKLLPSDAPGAPCMIYGAIHLTRLLSKFKRVDLKLF